MKNLPKLMILIIFFLLFVQVWVANRLTSAGLQLANLSNQEEKLNQENDFLEGKIVVFSSLNQIAQRAKEVGFVKAKPFYLTPELPVALENLNAVTSR